MKRLMTVGVVLAALVGAMRVLRPRARVALERRTGEPGPRLEADLQLDRRDDAG